MKFTYYPKGIFNYEASRLLLAVALRVPFGCTGSHPNKVFYQSKIWLPDRFQIAVHFRAFTIQWDDRTLNSQRWNYSPAFGFWGRRDPLPRPDLFGRVIHAFGYESDLLSAHEKMDLVLDLNNFFG